MFANSMTQFNALFTPPSANIVKEGTSIHFFFFPCFEMDYLKINEISPHTHTHTYTSIISTYIYIYTHTHTHTHTYTSIISTYTYM